MAREIITLSNGKKVSNFSSPHSFTFTDGSELPAVTLEKSIQLEVTFIEEVDDDGDVNLNFELSKDVIDEMKHWQMWYEMGEVDVVFCCLPMITAIKNYINDEKLYTLGIKSLKDSPFRTIRIENRIKKLLSIDKQCV